MIAPGMYGPHHQHFFNVRLDMAVDGPANRVYEVSPVALPEGPGNPVGNAWRVEETLIDAARQGRDADQTLTSIVSLLGCDLEGALALAAELGWKREVAPAAEAKPVWQRMRVPKHARRNRARANPIKTNSPFAGLARLISAD